MTRKQPRNNAASIWQRLLHLLRQQNEDFQLVLVRYSLERFLYRLSQSQYRKTLVLKGALLFQVWTRESHRPTRDVDFLGYGEPTEARLKEIVEQICQIKVADDGLIFEPNSIVVESMKEGENYQGIQIKLNCRLESARIPVHIDIGFGDAVTPEPIEINFPVILDQKAPRLFVYPRETVVSEKFQAIVSLGMTNSRMKDFFDLCVFLSSLNLMAGCSAKPFERPLNDERHRCQQKFHWHLPTNLQRTSRSKNSGPVSSDEVTWKSKTIPSAISWLNWKVF